MSRLLAKDIDPRLLNGLIPVNSPAFETAEGDTRCCITFGWRVEDESPLSNETVELLVEQAIKKNYKYLYWIQHLETREDGDLYHIRGAYG